MIVLSEMPINRQIRALRKNNKAMTLKQKITLGVIRQNTTGNTEANAVIYVSKLAKAELLQKI